MLKISLQQRHIPGALVNIICGPFEQSLNKKGKMSFAELVQLKEMMQELLILLPENADDIRHHLLHLNFNSKDFFDHYMEQLVEFTKGMDNSGEKIGFYSLQLKLINQVQIKPGICLEPALPSIRDQIGSWIGEELYFLEKKRQQINHLSNTKNGESFETEKIQTSLSVAHLSLGLKLLMDAGVIVNKNSSELMRTVARNFRTERMESISEGSLRKKAYNFESGTVEGVKDLIIKMLNLVRSY